MTARVRSGVVLACPNPSCDWKSKPSTERVADYARRRHSCDTHAMRKARTQRRIDQLNTAGPERPCTHGGRHEHGTRNRYVIDRCRCLPCKNAAREYETQRRRDRIYGRASYVDADPARRYVRELQAAGMGWKRVAKTAELDPSVLSKLLYGDRSRGMGASKRVRQSTADAILAVHLDVAPGALVSALGTHRRIQALVAIGWSQAKIAHRLGMIPSNFACLLHREQLTAGTVRAIARIYDELWDVKPPTAGHRDRIAYTRSLTYARKRHWAPPLGWDEDTIEDPDAKPQHRLYAQAAGVDEAVIERRLAGDQSVRLSRAERWVIVRRLHSQGLNDQEIARQTGLIDRTIIRDRQSLGLRANVQPRDEAGAA